MNRVFKTKWSAAHQEYVVTDEHHTSKTKTNKSVVALAVAAMMLAAGSASAAYLPGYMTQGLSDFVGSQVATWETAEYQKDWGLKAMNASTAYALGFHGQKTWVGVMDSGALLKHKELAGGRITGQELKDVEYTGKGHRYPQYVGEKDKNGNPLETRPYKPGDKQDVTGDWMIGINDSHGTHVTGTVGANRDGEGFHGVAWGSNIYVGNTGATDDNNYGPFQDTGYFTTVWKDVADKLVKENGKVGDAQQNRGGVINNSWGTNTRVVDQKDKGHDGYNTGVHLNVNTQEESDYEYVLFRKFYDNVVTDVANDGFSDKASFVYAAYEAVAGDKNSVQIMTTGNRDMKNPYYRALYPYYNPAAEKHWIAVAGLKQGAKAGTYELIKNFNEAGIAKWWTVAAPGNGIYSSTTDDEGNPGFASWGGTSMAAPHVAGAMGVLMSRYQQMTALQVRDVMFTTANHFNEDGSLMEGWKNVDGTTPEPGQVSDRMGWGVPDLAKGMFGPGQFLGTFEYDLAKDTSDVWTNDITNTALDQRLTEDEAWMLATAQGTKLPNGYVIIDGSGFVVKDGKEDVEGQKMSHEVDKAQAETLIKEAYAERAHAISQKLDNEKAGYKGSLVKKGAGTLVMTGNNDYKGTTTVSGGTLLAFSESIGTDNKVSVGDKGTFGVLSSYDDKFTKKGHLDSKEALSGKLDIDIAKDGTLYVDAASNVKVNSVTFNGGTKNIKVGLAGADRQSLIDAYKGDKSTLTGSFETVKGNKVFEGVSVKPTTETAKTPATGTIVQPESYFFKIDEAKGEGNKLTVSMSRDKDATFASLAKGGNQLAIAKAIEASENGLMGDMLLKDKESIQTIYAGLDDDFYVTARNALVMNATMVTRSVLEQAQGMGEGRAAELDEGRARIWATGMGLWGNAEGNASGLDVDFRVGMLGGEIVATDTTKVGAFFGYGGTDYSGVQGKIDADDTHYGIYAMSDLGNVSLTYGLAYTSEERDTTRYLMGTPTNHTEDASVLQGFVEAGYNFQVAAAKVTPYAGFTWARVKSDDTVDNAQGHAFKTEGANDDIQIATLGVRTALPFNWGTLPVALKADAGWSHFFGDKDGAASVQMGANGKFASIEGSDLKDQFNLGLGLVGKVGKNATVGFSYTGAWGSDVDTHGIMANARFNF